MLRESLVGACWCENQSIESVVFGPLVSGRRCESHAIEEAMLGQFCRALSRESIVGACYCESQLIEDVLLNVALMAPLWESFD